MVLSYLFIIGLGFFAFIIVGIIFAFFIERKECKDFENWKAQRYSYGAPKKNNDL